MGNNKYKILIVEDEANIRSFIKANLETSDYQVLCAETCALGMMMYASHHPDLIVLDLGLPDRDGMSLIQEVRKTDTVPIIVLSARSNERDKVEALDLGANDYITKPFGTEELLARIRAVLRSHRHSEENESGPRREIPPSGLTDRLRYTAGFCRERGDRPDPDGIQHHGVSLRSRRKGADVCRHHSGGLGVFGLWQRQKAASQHEEHP